MAEMVEEGKKMVTNPSHAYKSPFVDLSQLAEEVTDIKQFVISTQGEYEAHYSNYLDLLDKVGQIKEHGTCLCQTPCCNSIEMLKDYSKTEVKIGITRCTRALEKIDTLDQKCKDMVKRANSIGIVNFYKLQLVSGAPLEYVSQHETSVPIKRELGDTMTADSTQRERNWYAQIIGGPQNIIKEAENNISVMITSIHSELKRNIEILKDKLINIEEVLHEILASSNGISGNDIRILYEEIKKLNTFSPLPTQHCNPPPSVLQTLPHSQPTLPSSGAQQNTEHLQPKYFQQYSQQQYPQQYPQQYQGGFRQNQGPSEMHGMNQAHSGINQAPSGINQGPFRMPVMNQGFSGMPRMNQGLFWMPGMN